MTLSEKLRALIAEKGMSQADLARATGAGKSTVTGWLRGTSPSLEMAIPLARALEVPLDYLADGGLDAPPPPPDPAEAELLRIARRIGVDEAIDRILERGRSPRTDKVHIDYGPASPGRSKPTAG